MADGAINKQVTIALEGMTYNGATEVTYTPTQQTVNLTCKTTTATDAVSFTLDADGYNIASAEGSRQTYTFNGEFVDVTSLKTEADTKVDFTFNISDDALKALKKLYPDAGDAGVPMYVTLDRLHPVDNQLVYSQARAEGDRYIYRIKQSGTQTIKLATTDADAGVCTVTLKADYFDDETVVIYQGERKFSGTITVNNSLNFSSHLQTNYSYSSSAKINVKVGGNQVDVTNWNLIYTTNNTSTCYNWNTQYYYGSYPPPQNSPKFPIKILGVFFG